MRIFQRLVEPHHSRGIASGLRTMKRWWLVSLAVAVLFVAVSRGHGSDPDRRKDGRKSTGAQKAAIKQTFENATLPPASVEAMHKLLEALQRVKDNLMDLQPLGDRLEEMYDVVNGSGAEMRPWIRHDTKDRQLLKKTFGYRVTLYASPDDRNGSRPNVTEEIILSDDDDGSTTLGRGTEEDDGLLESAASDHVKIGRKSIPTALGTSAQYTRDDGYEDDDEIIHLPVRSTGHEHRHHDREASAFGAGNHDQTAKTSKSKKAKHSEERGARLRKHHSGASAHDEHAHDRGAANERAFREKTHIEYFEKEHFLDAAYDKAEKAHDRHRSLTELEAHREHGDEETEKRKTSDVEHRQSHHPDGNVADSSRKIERLVQKAVAIPTNDSVGEKPEDASRNRTASGRRRDPDPTDDLKRLGSKRDEAREIRRKAPRHKGGNGQETLRREVRHRDSSARSGSGSDSDDKRAHHREEGDKEYHDADKGHRKQGYRERGFKIMTEVELIDRGVHHDTAYGRRDRAKSVKHRERERHSQQKGDEKKDYTKEQTLHRDHEDSKHERDRFTEDGSHVANSLDHDDDDSAVYYLPSENAFEKSGGTTPRFSDNVRYPARPTIPAIRLQLGGANPSKKLEYKPRMPSPEKQRAKSDEAYKRMKHFHRSRDKKLREHLAANAQKPKPHRPPVGLESFLRDIDKQRTTKSSKGSYRLMQQPSTPLKRPPLRHIDDRLVLEARKASKFGVHDAKPAPHRLDPNPAPKLGSTSHLPQVTNANIPSHVVLHHQPGPSGSQRITLIPSPPTSAGIRAPVSSKDPDRDPDPIKMFKVGPPVSAVYHFPGPRATTYASRYENNPLTMTGEDVVMYLEDYGPFRRTGLAALPASVSNETNDTAASELTPTPIPQDLSNPTGSNQFIKYRNVFKLQGTK